MEDSDDLLMPQVVYSSFGGSQRRDTSDSSCERLNAQCESKGTPDASFNISF